MSFGSSHTTSDLIVDTIERWWLSLSINEQELTHKIQIKVDNGSESSGVRTQFLEVTYNTGVSLSKPQMKVVEQSLKRNPELPKWDILIHP